MHYSYDNSFSTSYSSGSSSVGAGNYQSEYDRWEQRAKSNYETLTNLGYSASNKRNDKSGSTGQSMNTGNYVMQKKALRDAQREMRNIRQKAARAGVHITQSKWETATVNYWLYENGEGDTLAVLFIVSSTSGLSIEGLFACES